MKGLRFNEYFRQNFGGFLNNREDLVEYLDEEMSSKLDRNRDYNYANDKELSKDVFINWQRERFSDHENIFYGSYYREREIADKSFQYEQFADKNDQALNNDKIAEMIIDPRKLAHAAGWKKAYGYDRLIDCNIKTAVANGANIYQALAYLAEAGNRALLDNKNLKKTLNDKDTTAIEKEELRKSIDGGIEDADNNFVAEQNLLRYQSLSPYTKLYNLTARLQDLQDQLKHPEHLSDAEYYKLLDDIEEQKEKIDAEILEFDPNELKLINDSRKTYFDLAANPEKTWESNPDEQLRIKNYSPEMVQCDFVSNRIKQLERQNKFESNKENE